jgi:hypothetical protein
MQEDLSRKWTKWAILCQQIKIIRNETDSTGLTSTIQDLPPKIDSRGGRPTPPRSADPWGPPIGLSSDVDRPLTLRINLHHASKLVCNRGSRWSCAMDSWAHWCQCLETGSLPWGYLGQLFSLRHMLELNGERRNSRFILVWDLDRNRVITFTSSRR